MTDPQTTRSRVRYPRRTKVVIAVVLLLAGVGVVVAVSATDTGRADDALAQTGGGPTSSQPVAVTIAPGVERRSPRPDAEVLAQEAIELDLAPGWTGELTIRPAGGSSITPPDDQIEAGALDILRFQPGEGKVVERLPSGRLCVEATIWDQVRGRAATERVEEWCFDVT